MSARLSACGSYRYELHRIWDTSLQSVLFIGLNPSTADHTQDDNTSRVCINYARRWGYGSLVIANLFAYRSTDPRGLKSALNPVGPQNNRILRRLCKKADMVICAWSDMGNYLGRDNEVIPFIKQPHCLTLLKSGRPGHPLYKSRTLLPKPMPMESIIDKRLRRGKP